MMTIIIIGSGGGCGNSSSDYSN